MSIPWLKQVRRSRIFNLRYLMSPRLAFPPGHFYSPICNPTELQTRYRDPETASPCKVSGIDLRRDQQVALWESWKPFIRENSAFLADECPKRYRTASSSYDIGDALIYACMLRHFRPARLIEIGSGASSALALDIFDRFFPEGPPQATFIDPYPAYLRSLLKPLDVKTVTIIGSAIQDVDLAIFDNLRDGDFLFTDSTHIVKSGSDVHHELFEIMPRLRRGVIVHFHDVFFPFEYPRRWVIDLNYSWNEIYFLRAWLTANQEWEILFFNDYFAKSERWRFERDAPEVLQNPGGGLWLRRR